MRGLAGYAMRGRREALLVAIFATAVPMFFWVGAAVVGLVTLRRGSRDGADVLMWALAPALVLAWFGEIMPAAALAGTWAAAAVLRATVSWQYALLVVSATGLLLGVGLVTAGSEWLAEAERLFAEFFRSLAVEAKDPAAAQLLRPPAAVQIAGMFGLMHALTLLGCVALARWWQAVLYNPGGFRAEFHALRLGQPVAIALLVGAAALFQAGPDYRVWAWIVCVPALACGAGLVHAVVAARGGSGGMLGLFYALLLLVPVAKYAVVMLAALDAFADLRARIGPRPPAKGND